jgi:aldehyde dehydrogenase (NAD+)
MQKLFIEGKWSEASGGETISVIDPSTGETFDQLARGTQADIERAVGAARRALDGTWGRLSAMERGRVLLRMSQLIAARAEELAAIEARDTGKPMATARADIEVTARYFEFYGGAADKLQGQVVPFLSGHNVMVLREPYGVTGHIIPWNYPAQMMGRSLAPALATGNAAVLKPAEDACLSTLRIAELALEAGMPPGALNVVTGLGEEAGAALTAHRGVNLLSFTGSPQVGTLVQKAAAENHVKVVLELGGKSPQIVFDDADLERALPVIVRAIVQNAGQTCTAGSRVLVQKEVYDDFVDRLAARFNEVRVGTPQMNLDCGPLINRQQLERVTGYIEHAVETGVKVLAKGRLADGVPGGGYFVEPTLFGPVPREHRLAREEVFGPVLAVIPFADEADAVQLANATDYGLLAAVWTRDGGRQTRVAKRLQCGQVFVNCYGAGGGVELPFGGVKKSGHGREKGFMALEEFSVTKTIVQFHGE